MTEHVYASGCVPDADDFGQAEAIHKLFSLVLEDTLRPRFHEEKVAVELYSHQDEQNNPVWVPYD